VRDFDKSFAFWTPSLTQGAGLNAGEFDPKAREVNFFGRKAMKLSPPSFGVFLISVIIVLVVLLSNYTSISVPVLTPLFKGKEYYAVLLAWIILFVGVAFNV
jgi:hypothetical protein